MKNLSVASAFAAALLVASAANAATDTTTQKATQQDMQTSAKAGPVVDPDAMKALNHNNLRQELRDNLAKSGFTSIKIMPSSFYVQAKDKNGNPVAMVIGPDSFTEVTEVTAAPGQTAQHAPPPSATQTPAAPTSQTK
jgi:hypothetical protein